ncbi:MAG: hypothetical protein K2M43_03265 [Mycoplasmoidaceae bacterium]|nr:hypothetical protein [Mycoplasmoidaceae bacterium]
MSKPMFVMNSGSLTSSGRGEIGSIVAKAQGSISTIGNCFSTPLSTTKASFGKYKPLYP